MIGLFVQSRDMSSSLAVRHHETLFFERRDCVRVKHALNDMAPLQIGALVTRLRRNSFSAQKSSFVYIHMNRRVFYRLFHMPSQDFTQNHHVKQLLTTAKLACRGFGRAAGG
jgi:hypothetical protein